MGHLDAMLALRTTPVSVCLQRRGVGDAGLSSARNTPVKRGLTVAVLLMGILATNTALGVSGTDTITTVAGTGTFGFSGDGGPATAATLFSPSGIALDTRGNLYIAEHRYDHVRKVAPDGTISTIAGTGLQGFSGDGGPATQAQLNDPTELAADGRGSLYIADSGNHRVRRIAPDGTISTVAGTGVPGFSGDGGPATLAQIHAPNGVAVDRQGNLYFLDSRNLRVRRVALDGTIATVVGTGAYGFAGDGGPATLAELRDPLGLAIDEQGSLYIGSGLGGRRVRKVAPDGTISTVAGGGAASPVDGVLATSAALSVPAGLTVDRQGSVYIADSGYERVFRVAPDGTISTVAGGGASFPGDGGPATAAVLGRPGALAIDVQGSLYIAEYLGQRIRKISSLGAAAQDLERTIPDPQRLGVGPVSATAPGRISLGSLRSSKCVLVRLRAMAPARVLVTIFSGRKSIRLFGQKRVVFRRAVRRDVCITVPLRAHTFDVRTPLRVALGVAPGATPRRGERKPKPVVRPIRLVP
jgi:sugar lactone lactonase YvrE